MYSSSLIVLALSAFGAFVAAVPNKQEQPACVSKCWDNSQYVSNCAGDQQCLCDDADFQNALYQCLYSQCQTAQFGIALHHALDLCAADSINYNRAPSRQGDLRARGYQSLSNSVTYTRSSARASGTPATAPGSQTLSVSLGHSSSRAGGTTPVGPATVTVTETASGYQSSVNSGKPSTYTHSTGPATYTSSRGSQSVSAYQAYSTSRANPAGNTVLTMATVTVTIRPSHAVVRTSTISVKHTPSPSPAGYSSASPSSKSTVTVTSKSTVTATVHATTSSAVPSAYVPTPQAVRRQWNGQRYPSDTQS